MLAFKHEAFDARVFYKESLSLSRNGYEVTVLARQRKKEFAGKPKQEDENTIVAIHEGVKIIRLKGQRGWLRLLGNILAFYRQALAVDADIYHCHESDFSVLVGLLVKRKMKQRGKRVRLIFDVHEYWPGAFAGMFKTRLFQRLGFHLFTWWEKFALRRCDLIFTANEIERSYYLLKNRFQKVEVLYNCPPISLFKETGASRQEFIVCHEGSLGFKRGMRPLIESLKILVAEGCPVKYLIIGDVYEQEKPWLQEKIANYQLQDKIEITGWLPYPEIGQQLARASLGLILFQPTLNNMLAGPPNKLFNYMLFGLGIISANLPETSRIIRENDCGVILRDDSARLLAAEIQKLYADPKLLNAMAENAKNAAISKYNWAAMEKRLIARYEELIDA